ncbi:uncharacterized PE-PGRS family protein PE_PGRS20 [Eurosta solidaginis]|uniref:uncharacterized PE-PGRS family protein PE_PGRS20 n=1 Tax=Eurosta solidaginis TaxID=178769 RepID=UPI003530FA1B
MATTKIFVGSLPPGTKPEELRHLFEDYGVVVECDVMNRCGFVHMETKEMANTAIAALNSSEFKGQMIVVELGRPKDKKPGVGNAVEGARGGRGGNMGARGAGRGGPPRGGGARGGIAGNRGGGPGNPGRGGLGNRGGGPGKRGGGALGMGGPGGGGPNFGGAVRGGPNKFGAGGGPMRNDHLKQQRSMPYQRRNPQDGVGGGPGGGGRGNFNNFGMGGRGGFSRFGGDGGQQNFPNFDAQPNDNSVPFGGISNYNDNEMFPGNFGGNMGGNMAGGLGGNKGLAGQDRRGFALPTGGRGGGQRFGAGNRGGFNGGIQGNAGLPHNPEDNLYSRRNDNGLNMNNGAHAGFRGGFGNVRGNGPPNVGARGGFRRGGGMGGGPVNEGFSGPNSYSNNFPPLGVQGIGGGGRGGPGSGGRGGAVGRGGRGGGGGGRGGRGGGMQHNGPRQNMVPNQRF